MDSVYQRDTCRLCDSHNLERVLHLTPTPPGDIYIPIDHINETQETYPLDICLCHNCGNVQLCDVVNPEILYGKYLYESSISLGLVEHFRRLADEIVEYINPPNGSLVIDIGSNDGSLLKAFKDKGMQVLGIEPARAIAQKAMESGIKTLPAFFSSELAHRIKKEYGQASIITANYVFANVDDLTNMTNGIRELLAPDGLFILETGYLLDIIKNLLFDTIYHEHLSYFSVRPLKVFFEHHDMKLINVKRVPTKGGALRCTVQHKGGKYKISPSVDELITLEKNFHLDKAEIFRFYAAKIENAKKKLLNLLHNIKKQRKTVAGYGASVAATTLIYHFNLGDKLKFIVDDNQKKQNLFSPGWHIPVLSPQAIYDQKSDYVIVLAWLYAEEIIKKHQGYLKQGGHFIVPLPELKIVGRK